MKAYRRPLLILLVLYVLSIGPAFGLALSQGAYPAPNDQPVAQTLTAVYYPVESVADAAPLIGIPLRRYQRLWFRVLSH